MSANLCLIAWNDPIGTPNCSRCFAYSSEMSNAVCAVPTHSSASATVAVSIARRSATAVAGPGSPSTRSADTSTPSRVTVAITRLASSAGRGRIGHVGRRHDERRDAIVTGGTGEPRDHHDLVRGRRLHHEVLLAVEPEPAVAERASRSRCTSAGSNAAVRLGERERPGRLALGDRPEEPRLLLGCAELAERGDELRDRREQRTGRDDPAELLGDERRARSGRARARRTPRESRAPASRARPSASRAHRVVGARRRGAPPRSRGPSAVGHSAASTALHGVAQVVLVGRELELHAGGTLPDVRVSPQRRAPFQRLAQSARDRPSRPR